MFKVKHKKSGSIRTVYQVKYDGIVGTEFLLYMYKWVWVRADEYEPYEE